MRQIIIYTKADFCEFASFILNCTEHIKNTEYYWNKKNNEKQTREQLFEYYFSIKKQEKKHGK